MSHVDEGTLHALLDGELAPAEVVEVQTHFATCPACSARLDSARKLLAETERLVSALEPSAALSDRLGARAARPPVEPPPAVPVAPWLSAVDSMVLIPNNPTAAEVRRSRLRILAWAAGVLVVVGAGVFGVQIQMGVYDRKPAGMLRIRPEEFSAPGTLADSVAAARAAAAGATQPSAPAAQQPKAPAPAPESKAQPARQPPPQPARQPPPPQPARQQPPPPANVANAQGRDRPAGEVADAAPSDEDRDAIAARAAKATQALDRERNQERAAAATAALDSARREAAQKQAATPAAPPAPVVPTLDQRAQIANRIGLDEAARQLGGPLHAIDGMSRQLVGVVSPQLVPGTDTSRAVVRAVYVDRAGRLIFLDQQRVRAGQTDLPFTPQARRNGELRWMAGQVLVVLQADLPTDSLRFIGRHVR